ncbi:MAG: DUF739 domain-containing protein [Clostridiales bacterium]
MNINGLKGIIRGKGMTQEDVAKRIGLSLRTFNCKLNKGVFGSDEMERMIEVLCIENPGQIFFGK